MTHPHSLVALVTLLALLVVVATQFRVGRARAVFGVKAPATTGHEIFERHYRVQMNTVEQIVIFLPSLWLFALSWPNQILAAGLGLVWVAGRILYMVSYAGDPGRRHVGFLLAFIPTTILLIGAAIGVIRVMTVTGGI